jgi:hypothetical protein
MESREKTMSGNSLRILPRSDIPEKVSNGGAERQVQ